tara:strand:+ start:1490 stop:2467 length:978 start_codon:yes stop_codon:yes gene_type:complete
VEDLPVQYDDLLRYVGSVDVFDSNDNNTLWQRVYYNDNERLELENNLKKIYNVLYSDGSDTNTEFITIDGIDYCTFGNSNPFRVKVRNKLNDNFTYYYIKKADSSRIYGLELEHITSPYNLNFILNNNTLIEEHISGIPGDDFFDNKLKSCNDNEKSQIAKEFVKFSERCMIRLLGDMRSYNYVIIPIHDFDQVVYKIRAIDFDQQSYEADFKVYRPQLFKENMPVVELIKEKLIPDSINQYKIEERAIIVKRILGSQKRVDNLLSSMKNDSISNDENVRQLSQQIYHLTKDNDFKYCTNMGQIMESSFNYLLSNYESSEMLRTN